MTSFSDGTEQFELVVGLEVHVQLNTRSKIFSADRASFATDPNRHISPVSLGLPGTLPFLNEKAVEYAVKAGLALGCSINLENRFDRKNYFYADLPKGYQITQDALPICRDGLLQVTTATGESRAVRINRIHLEEDAGKSLHDQDDMNTLVDLNRAGVPLIEIVSEPDIRSAEEAAAYVSAIRKIVRFLGVSDGNMEEGSLRCDANISIRKKGSSEYGKRCEVKNLNSIRNLQRAIQVEYGRQCGLALRGEPVEQHTLNFDASSGAITPLRSKEMANDYRYFPEPDLPPVVLTREYVEAIAASLPELPEQLVQRLRDQYGLSAYDASLIGAEQNMAEYFEQVISFIPDPKAAANWINGPVRSWLNESGDAADVFPVPAQRLAELIGLIGEGKLSFSVASQEVFPAIIREPGIRVPELAARLNVLITAGADEMERLADEVLQLFPDKVREYKNGKKGVLGLFMGEFMKRSKGKADPKTASRLIETKLEEIQ